MKSLRDYMNDAFSYLQPEKANEKTFKPLPWYMKEAEDSIAKRPKDGVVTYNLTLKLPDGKTQRVCHQVSYKNGVEQAVKEERYAGKDGVERKLYEKDFLVVDGVMFEEKSLRNVLSVSDETKKAFRADTIVTSRTVAFAEKLKDPALTNDERRVWLEGIASEPPGTESGRDVGLKVSPIQEHARALLSQDTISAAETKELLARIEHSKLGKESSDIDFARLHHTRQVMIAEVKRELALEQQKLTPTSSAPGTTNNIVPIRPSIEPSPHIETVNGAVPTAALQPDTDVKQPSSNRARQTEKEEPDIM